MTQSTTPDPTNTVAVLGTGIIGAAIARNLAKHSFAVRVWNRTRTKAEALVSDGIEVADTPAKAVREAGIVITALNDGPRVLEAMTTAVPGLTKGAIWAQLSTVGVEAIPALATLADAHELTFIDAPVQGTKQPAEQGQLVVLASGPQKIRDTIQPVFDVIGKRTIWVADNGAEGTSSKLKLALNAWVLALTHGVAESFAIATALGIDPKLVADVVSGGPLDNAYFQLKGAAILANDYATSFSVANAAKDAALVIKAAEKAHVHADITAAGWERFQRAIAQGHEDKDMAATYLASFED